MQICWGGEERIGRDRAGIFACGRLPIGECYPVRARGKATRYADGEGRSSSCEQVIAVGSQVHKGRRDSTNRIALARATARLRVEEDVISNIHRWVAATDDEA